MDATMTRMFFFLLIFNMLFSTFSYALTVFPASENVIDYSIEIERDKLLEYGITFVNASSLNVTFDGGWNYFTYNDRDFRIQWIDGALTADYIYIEKKTWLGEKLDSWLFTQQVSLNLVDENLVVNALYNGTIVNYWDTENDWLRMNIDSGVIGFLSTLAADTGNITKAVYDTGTLTFTVGETDQTTAFDVNEFIDWYTAMILGLNYSGLPGVFNWVFRGLLSINIIIGVFAARDLTKL